MGELRKGLALALSCYLMANIAHFVETCSKVGNHDDMLVDQFACTLKGNAFD